MIKVITYGSFDLFHIGHFRLLERAKALGDYLIVGITTEQYDIERGKLNVVDSLSERVENVRKSGFADQIVIEDHVGQKIEDIQKYNVDIFTVGSDWAGKFDYLKDYCKVVYLERTKGISSTMLRSENFGIIRLGIIGSGRVAHRFVPEIKYVSGINAEIVYNRHIESAKRLADAKELARYTDNIEEFYENCDAVYIASPHNTHYSYIKDALLHDKHVLCEKPMVLAKKEAEELFCTAKEKKLVLMEALKTAYAPGFIKAINMAKSGVIGEIKDIEAAFTRIVPNKNIREFQDTVYGGSFTEYGSYTMLPIVKLLGADYKKLEFRSFKADNGVDVYTKAMFDYGKAIATSKTGIAVKSEGQLLIAGTAGYMLISSPWWKTQNFEICYEDFNQNEKHYAKYLGDGLRYEIAYFVSAINGKNRENFKLSQDESTAMADVMERFLKERKNMMG